MLLGNNWKPTQKVFELAHTNTTILYKGLQGPGVKGMSLEIWVQSVSYLVNDVFSDGGALMRLWGSDGEQQHNSFSRGITQESTN